MDSNQVKRYFVGEEKLFDQFMPDWRQQVNNDVRRSLDGLKIIIELNVDSRFDSAFNPDLGIQKLTQEEIRVFIDEHAAEWKNAPVAETEPKRKYEREELMEMMKAAVKQIAESEFGMTTAQLTKLQLIDMIIGAQG